MKIELNWLEVRELVAFALVEGVIYWEEKEMGADDVSIVNGLMEPPDDETPIIVVTLR